MPFGTKPQVDGLTYLSPYNRTIRLVGIKLVKLTKHWKDVLIIVT